MKQSTVSLSDLRGIIAVPPLPRRDDPERSLNFEEAEKLLRHIASGGITHFMFGGNAFFYHVTLREYAAVLDWMAGLPDHWWLLPSAGPGFGRLMDQAEMLRSRGFPAVMLLPCSDPRDAAGLSRGIREFVLAAETPAVIYLKGEDTLGSDREAGLDVLGSLCADGVCVAVKYAVVREDPAVDPYLEGLLKRIDRHRVVSGIGERPAVIHLRDWRLTGFTTGSGCVAPDRSRRLFEECAAARWDEAEKIRKAFIPLEDRRDAWNPAKVLHHAVDLAGIVRTGPLPPFLSALPPAELEDIRESLKPLLATEPALEWAHEIP